MSKFQGYVVKALRKDGTTKQHGKAWFKFNIKVTQDDGQESPWISFPFNKACPFAEGQYVSFDTTLDEKGYHNLVEGSGAFPTPPAKAAVAAAVPNSPAKGSTSSGYQDRNPQIVYQSSRKDALEFVQIALANDALPLLGTKGKAAEAKRFEEVLDYVNKLTVQFYNDVTTLRLLESIPDAGTVAVGDELPSAEETAEEAPAPIANSSLDEPAKF